LEDFDFVPLGDVVVVHEHDEVAGGRGDRRIACCAEISIRLADDLPAAPIEIRLQAIEEASCCRLIAAVVDQHELDSLVRLSTDRRDRFAQ
jgi:hypothetical protein